MSTEKGIISHVEESHGHDSHTNIQEPKRTNKAILLDIGASQAKDAASHLKLSSDGRVSFSLVEFPLID